jgi:predicted ArsR family transcriptional regulator
MTRRRANFDIYEEKILEVLYKHPVSLSTSEVADKADIAWETAKDRLEDLWDDHYIEREDKGNSIEWWIED